MSSCTPTVSDIASSLVSSGISSSHLIYEVQARAEEEEFKRAQERLTLKHRNTSRWARRVLKRGLSLASSGQQDALHDQLRLGQALRAKAASMHDANDGDASDGRCVCL